MKINHTQDVSNHKTEYYLYKQSQETQPIKAGDLVLNQEESAVLTISQEGQEQAAVKENKADHKNAEQTVYQQMADQERIKREEGKDTARTQLLCMEIARRITAGDKVPQQDVSYLIKHDPDLYGRAMSMRIQKKDPEEYESLLEDDEREEFHQIKELLGGLTGDAPSLIIDIAES